MKSRSVRGYNKIICFCKHYFLAISIFCPNFCRQGPLGERARLGPHMFSEHAGTPCPWYRAWHIGSKTDLSFDTLSTWNSVGPKACGRKPLLSLPVAQGLGTASRSPLLALSIFALCSHTPLGQGESGSLPKGPPRASLIHWGGPYF